jgi:hypothetical protein
MVRPDGFSPPTRCFEGSRSNKLSYGRMFLLSACISSASAPTATTSKKPGASPTTKTRPYLSPRSKPKISFTTSAIRICRNSMGARHAFCLPPGGASDIIVHALSFAGERFCLPPGGASDIMPSMVTQSGSLFCLPPGGASDIIWPHGQHLSRRPPSDSGPQRQEKIHQGIECRIQNHRGRAAGLCTGNGPDSLSDAGSPLADMAQNPPHLNAHAAGAVGPRFLRGWPRLCL